MNREKNWFYFWEKVIYTLKKKSQPQIFLGENFKLCVNVCLI